VHASLSKEQANSPQRKEIAMDPPASPVTNNCHG
jgi:hypothetical protein